MHRGHEFIIVQDVMKEGFEGELEMVKEDAITRWYCADLNLITDIEQVYSSDGTIRTKYCRVYHSILGERVVREKYLTMKLLLQSIEKTFFKEN